MFTSCATYGLVNEYLKMNLRIIKIVIKLPKALNIALSLNASLLLYLEGANSIMTGYLGLKVTVTYLTQRCLQRTHMHCQCTKLECASVGLSVCLSFSR